MQTWIKNYRAFAFGLVVILVLGLAGAAILPFIPALLWATVLSVLTYPLYSRANRRFEKVKLLKDGRSATAASLVVTLLTLFVICIPFVLIGVGLFIQVESVTAQLQGQGQGDLTFDSLLKQVDASIHPLLTNIGAKNFTVVGYVNDHRQDLITNISTPLRTLATQAGFTILTLVFALLTQFFMLRDGHKLLEPAKDLLPFTRDRSQELFDRIKETIHAVFVGTVLVAIVQGIVIGITYAAVGIPNSILLGVVSAVLCIIPLLGAPVIYVPVGGMLLLQGKTTEAIIVLGVGFVIVSQIDNVLKPFLIGGRVDLHPMAIFFAILGGVILIGPIGVMAGPMLLTVLLALQDVIRESLRDSRATTLERS